MGSSKTICLAAICSALALAGIAGAQGGSEAARRAAEYRGPAQATAVGALRPGTTPVLGVRTSFVVFNVPYAPNNSWKSGEKVHHVQLGSPAARAGLKPGDIITTAGFRVLRSPSDLPEEIRDFTAAKEAQGLEPYLPLNLIDGNTGKPKTVTVRFVAFRDSRRQPPAGRR